MFEILKSIPFFAQFTPQQLSKVKSIINEKVYLKDSPIFLYNDSCNRAFILKKGKVKASKFSSEGKELIIKFFNPGDFFGEAPLFIRNGCYPASTYACEDSEVYYFTKHDFKKLILNDPEIALSIIEVYSTKLLTLVSIVEGLSLKNVKSRLINFLVEQIPKELQNSHDQIDLFLRFSQSEIAARLGTVREQISRIFSKLAQDGIIEIQGKKVTIYNLSKLKTEAIL